ncbi:MAG: polysaccharide deacetylase family protein [Oscillospiraceae bacterium]|nr:polysaccharide deacetylase family protein [Oscillospiraceae bacterium]
MKKKCSRKKIGAVLLSVMLSLGLALALAGCGGEETVQTQQGNVATQANGVANDPTASVVQIHTKGVKPKKGHRGDAVPADAEQTAAQTPYDNASVDLTGIDPEKPMIALTFDDGPGEGTERILQVLTDNGAKATFFELGCNVEKYPDLTKKLVDAGMQVASHSYSHPDLTTLSKKEVAKEISKTENAMAQAADHQPTMLRPPYGAINESVSSQLAYPIILWDVDTQDWSSRNADAICAEVEAADPSDGDIILFHDIYTSSAEAIERLVPQFKQQGFQMVTVAQMLAAKGIDVQNGTTYCNA